MIWAIVSCQSYFCWMYRASPSLAARNIINLILVLTIWWCHMCRVFSCVVGRGCLLWPVHSLGKTLIAFALFHSVHQGQICLLFQVFLDFLLLHSSPLYWKGHIFWVVVLKGLVGLHRTNFNFFSITGWGIDLDYCDVEWFALETNRNHSVIFEIASKYCILDFFVDYDGYSISSKGFLHTIVIWVRFTHSSPF